MRRLITTLGRLAILLEVLSSRAYPQQKITVQEPSLETFGVGTTVSVPDRGRMSLGGAGRSAMSRSMSGPFRRGTSMGLSSQGSGLSVGARVLDLAEMDKAALDAAAKVRRSRDEVRLPDGAEHAYETLRARRVEQDVTTEAQNSVVLTAPKRHEPDPPAVDAGPSSDKLLNRARQAEAAGKHELALAYLRVARDRGSEEARREIERLSLKTH